MMGGREGLVSLFMSYPHSTKKSWVIMNIVPFQTRSHNVEYLTPHFEAKCVFLFGKVRRRYILYHNNYLE